MAGVRRRALHRGRGGMGGAVARLPPPRTCREALGRPAVGGSPGERRRGRHRPRPRLRHRRAPDDPALPRAAARARAGKAAGRRLRLRRPLDRRGPPRVRPGSRRRHRSSRRRGDAARMRSRTGWTWPPSWLPRTPSSRRPTSPSRTSRPPRCSGWPAGSMRRTWSRRATWSRTSRRCPGTGASSAGSSRVGPATCTPGADSHYSSSSRRSTITPVTSFSVDFLGCKVSHADVQEIRERLLADGHEDRTRAVGPARAQTSR